MERYILDTTLCDKACQWITAGQTDHHDITENIITLTLETEY
jgi:hypothetical protein